MFGSDNYVYWVGISRENARITGRCVQIKKMRSVQSGEGHWHRYKSRGFRLANAVWNRVLPWSQSSNNNNAATTATTIPTTCPARVSSHFKKARFPELRTWSSLALGHWFKNPGDRGAWSISAISVQKVHLPACRWLIFHYLAEGVDKQESIYLSR